MIEMEYEPIPDSHLVDIAKLFPSGAAEISLIRLVGDLNHVSWSGLYQRDQCNLKPQVVMNVSMNHVHEVTSCVAGDGLNKIIRKQQLF